MQSKCGKRSTATVGIRLSSSMTHQSADYGIGMVLDYILTSAKGNERFYVIVNVLGMELTGLLNSGATRTIIGPPGFSLLCQLGFKWKKD